MKPNSNKLYHPFKEIPPCVCPMCLHDTLAYRQTETIFARVDEDGLPGDFVCNEDTIFHCLNCGYTSDKYIITDSGWRRSELGDDDYIRAIHKKHYETRTIENPFFNSLEDDK